MAEGVGEAVEIMKVTIDGSAHFVKFAFESTKELASLIIAIKKSYDANKIGQIPFDQLLKNCEGNVRLIKVPDGKEGTMADALTKYGVQFSQMVDLNLVDGYSEFAFSSGQSSLVKSVVDQLKFGELITLEDYTKNADPKIVEKYAKEIKKEESLKHKNSPSLSTVSSDGNSLEALAKEINSTAKENVQLQSKAKFRYIAEPNELIYKKDNKVLVPSKIKSIDNKSMYIQVDKEDVINKDNTLSIFFSDNKKYTMVDSKNNVLDSVNGRKIREEMLKKSSSKSKKVTKVTTKNIPLKR